MPGVSVAICDESGKPVPRGTQGEIIIGGRQVAQRYLGKPELSAEKFRPAACLGTGRAFRTGDFGIMSL